MNKQKCVECSVVILMSVSFFLSALILMINS